MCWYAHTLNRQRTLVLTVEGTTVAATAQRVRLCADIVSICQ